MSAVGAGGQDGTIHRIEEALQAPLAELGVDLEAIELTPAGKRRVLRIAIDRDGGVTLDDVADATKRIDAILESGDAMGEQPYTLEVTSRGVDRPLTLPRHWRRNEDRLVKVTLNPEKAGEKSGETFTGRIVDHDEDPAGSVDLETEQGKRTVPYADIAKALVQVEFNRKPSGKSAGAAGADAEETTEDTTEEDES